MECLSLASVNNSHTMLYDQNQEPNPIGNISLTLDSKRPLVVLALRVLLSNKKCLDDGVRGKNGIRNKKLKAIVVVNWNF